MCSSVYVFVGVCIRQCMSVIAGVCLLVCDGQCPSVRIRRCLWVIVGRYVYSSVLISACSSVCQNVYVSAIQCYSVCVCQCDNVDVMSVFVGVVCSSVCSRPVLCVLRCVLGSARLLSVRESLPLFVGVCRCVCSSVFVGVGQ